MSKTTNKKRTTEMKEFTIRTVGVRFVHEDTTTKVAANIVGEYNPATGTFRLERANDLAAMVDVEKLQIFGEGMSLAMEQLKSSEFFIRTKNKSFKQTHFKK